MTYFIYILLEYCKIIDILIDANSYFIMSNDIIAVFDHIQCLFNFEIYLVLILESLKQSSIAKKKKKVENPNLVII